MGLERLERRMNTIDSEIIRSEVRRRYGAVAVGSDESKGAASSGCCGEDGSLEAQSSKKEGCCAAAGEKARTVGYSQAELEAVPEGANLGLGCGNPVALASLRPGQCVLDLGSGAGFDAFLAARAVGDSGRVIGVDMTPEMVSRARANAKKGNYAQVEFRLGEIEALPVSDASVDVILSNCVINLCPDKASVYREAFRVLRPGGRLAVSDVVAHEALPAEVGADLALHCGCLAGATPKEELLAILQKAGFVNIAIRPKANSQTVIESWDSKRGFEKLVFSAEVTAVKPGGEQKNTRCCGV